MATNPKAEELTPEVLPPPDGSNISTTPRRSTDKEAMTTVAAVMAKELGESEYERFEKLARGLISVPKKEIDERGRARSRSAAC